MLNLPVRCAKSILCRNATSIVCFRMIIIFSPETRFLKTFTTNILSQFRSLQGEWPRSRGGGGGNHYHHIWPVKSCLTDFTQILPLVKCYISTPFGFWIYKRWMIHLSEVWLYTMYQVFKISWNLPIIITGSILAMGWVKYTRKGGDVKNGLKCEMDDGGVPSMASKAPTNHLFFPQAKRVTDYGNKQKSNKCRH